MTVLTAYDLKPCRKMLGKFFFNIYEPMESTYVNNYFNDPHVGRGQSSATSLNLLLCFVAPHFKGGRRDAKVNKTVATDKALSARAWSLIESCMR